MPDNAFTSPYPIFLDTEFTQFDDPVLISIALVTLEGGELVSFYAESTEFRTERASTFVREQVLPQLEGGVTAVPVRRLAQALRDWLAARRPGWVLVSDMADYDGELLAGLLRMASGRDGSGPPAILFRTDSLPKAQSCPAVQSVGEMLYGRGPHHALFDATTLMSAWFAAEAAGWDGCSYLSSQVHEHASTSWVPEA